MGSGRKTVLDEKMIQLFVENFQLGLSDEACYSLAGVSYTTFYSWINRGKKKDGKIFVEFLDRINAAKAEGEKALIKRIRKDQDWKAAAWILTHSPHHKKDWADRSELTGANGKSLTWKEFVDNPNAITDAE